MSTRIEDFLIELSKDPYRAMQFTQNPEAESALSADDKSVLIGDRDALDRTLHVAKNANEGKAKTVKTAKKPKAKKKK